MSLVSWVLLKVGRNPTTWGGWDKNSWSIWHSVFVSHVLLNSLTEGLSGRWGALIRERCIRSLKDSLTAKAHCCTVRSAACHFASLLRQLGIIPALLKENVKSVQIPTCLHGRLMGAQENLKSLSSSQMWKPVESSSTWELTYPRYMIKQKIQIDNKKQLCVCICHSQHEIHMSAHGPLTAELGNFKVSYDSLLWAAPCCYSYTQTHVFIHSHTPQRNWKAWNHLKHSLGLHIREVSNG